MSFNYRNFFPFPVTELSPADFAALPNRYQFPFAVALPRLCKWYWQAKKVSATWAASWTSVLPGFGGGTFTGTDSFSNAALDLYINTSISQTASTMPPIQRLVPLPVTPHVFVAAPITPSGTWDGGSYTSFLDGSVVGGVTFELFAGNYAAIQQYVVRCENLFYPSVSLAVQMYGLGGPTNAFFPPDWSDPDYPEGGGYLAQSAPQTGLAHVGDCIFEGFTIPMYGFAWGAPGSTLSASLTLALVNDYWTTD